MFPTYNSLAEVPEAFREHYVMKGGKAVAEVTNDHPLVANNATLLNEKNTAEARATKAEGDLESAKASSLPRGHIAVPKADHELLEKVKVHGTPDEVVAKLTEHGTLKESETRRSREDHLRNVGRAMGYDPEKTALLLADQELPDTEVRTGADGKESVIAKVKQPDGSLVEKSFAEVVTGTPKLSALVPSLKGGESGKTYPSQDAGGKFTTSVEQLVETNKKSARESGKYAM